MNPEWDTSAMVDDLTRQVDERLPREAQEMLDRPDQESGAEDGRLIVTVHMTVRQADALIRACDLAYRVAAGQWRDLAEFVGQNNTLAFEEARMWGALGETLSSTAMLVFPDKGAGGSYGILHPALHERIRHMDAVRSTLAHSLTQHPEAPPARPADQGPVFNWQQDGEPLPVVVIKPSTK